VGSIVALFSATATAPCMNHSLCLSGDFDPHSISQLRPVQFQASQAVISPQEVSRFLSLSFFYSD
jgi:hypothetical protein